MLVISHYKFSSELINVAFLLVDDLEKFMEAFDLANRDLLNVCRVAEDLCEEKLAFFIVEEEIFAFLIGVYNLAVLVDPF